MFLQRVLKAGLELMLVGGLACLCPSAVSAAQPESAQQAGIGPEAPDALKRMGKTLAAKQSPARARTSLTARKTA